jgi:4-methylaminobutanoate oxidase (formaldehyde-forming)
VYTQFCNRRGGIVADVTVTRLAEDRFRVVTGSAYVDADLGWLRANVQDEDVLLREASEELAVVGLWGPMAREVLGAVSEADLSNAAFPYMTARTIRVGPVEVLAQRVAYVGELGWELYVTPEHAVQVWDRLVAAGAPYGIQPGGYRVLDGLRIEKGYRYFGVDLTPGETPYEAGLGFCVALEKGGFLGREALLAAREPQRRLRTLVVGDERYLPIYGGEAVHVGDRVVGRLRSCAYGFTVRRNVAYAYLPIGFGSGARVEVEVFGRRVPAEVVEDVLHDPGHLRVRA